mmetsp:Transcript_14586/g.31046  ORF Transcript_14586/g.31046 Transcript_14586/m.31046 type:complete len:177 (+) Transcript_14586:186-716(+)|eukprot:CAMPEP_0168171356 /NCGR_PEP_ID=MMETSP0139_2-20121125/4664_1 /TAXON_ID=44445 /ORGANISM="Pseudo-nitzschia australis, Strain 10249 10 AB" /LENGTH=176 /DNA_ID=CAMNT_0008088909 /DNA_START=98 /DNA_END=628 /DNA_ORIENTATION=-
MPPPPSPPPSSRQSNVVLDQWNRFHKGHERLKNAVHSYWRQNTILSPRGTAGKIVMSCAYFSIPVVVGYLVVTSVVDRSESTVHERLVGSKGNGDGAATSNATGIGVGGEEDRQRQRQRQPQRLPAEKIGAGGWGGGVRLAESDAKTRDVNRINLERFLKKQRRLKEKREREEAQE